jgi:hypothetical protein
MLRDLVTQVRSALFIFNSFGDVATET